MIKKILPALAFAALIVGSHAFAENYSYSESEKAVFSFFKLSRHDPNYESWINATPFVNQIADGKKRAETYEQESLRLKWGFGTFDVTRDFLKINTGVMMSLTRGKNGTALNFMFPNSKPGEIPYFPYAYGQEWIALIIDDLANYTRVSLTPAENDHIRQYLREGMAYPVTLAVRVRAKKADSETPLNLDGVDQWIMSGEVGHIELFLEDHAGGENIALWEFTAPWYLTDTEKMLMPLLDEGISNAPPSP